MRQSYDSDIAEATRRMVAGEKDVLLITLDNKEYYLTRCEGQKIKDLMWLD